jgi:peptidoglycan/xylan/chitin deacetylase (PgdA/CDA1 family)
MILWKRFLYRDTWPIDRRANKPPDGWSGWPDQKQFGLVLTHDVDTMKGHDNCLQLMRLEQALGFRSSFNFVPERYDVSPEVRDELIKHGFEVGVHGLNHDGKLYKSEKIFRSRAVRINHYLKDWKAAGFRSPAMHHNLNWLHALDIDYDASTFDTDPFEPQSDGVGTIFPFWVEGNSTQRGYVELPYTLSQDFTLFVLCRETNVIWKQKLDWIVSKGGMVLMNTHPDYMNFDGKKLRMEEYPVQYYQELLQYIKSRYKGTYWHALPRDMSQFWSRNIRNR